MASSQALKLGASNHLAVGSSAGSAVAVSANLVPLSFGTETDTSVISPAMINGVVGIKPTFGLVSSDGIVPISKTIDTVGSFGRTVADAVAGLNAILGTSDSADTHSSSSNSKSTYSRYLSSKDALQEAKFGLPWKRCWELVPNDQRDVALKIFDLITEAGGEIIRTDFPCAEERIPSDGEWDWYA